MSTEDFLQDSNSGQKKVVNRHEFAFGLRLSLAWSVQFSINLGSLGKNRSRSVGTFRFREQLPLLAWASHTNAAQQRRWRREMKNKSDSRERKSGSNSSSSSNSGLSAKMPLRDSRSGKPGSSGSSSGEPGGWSQEAKRAGTGSSKSRSSQSGSSSKSSSSHSGTDRDGGGPSRQTETAGDKDESGLV
jgi:hypothetical protein